LADKRILRVHLTGDGKKLESILVKKVVRLQKEIFQPLRANELKQLSLILDKLLQVQTLAYQLKE
jgi:DNA-binding MarR family transcriptional regulator